MQKSLLEFLGKDFHKLSFEGREAAFNKLNTEDQKACIGNFDQHPLVVSGEVQSSVLPVLSLLTWDKVQCQPKLEEDREGFQDVRSITIKVVAGDVATMDIEYYRENPKLGEPRTEHRHYSLQSLSAKTDLLLETKV